MILKTGSRVRLYTPDNPRLNGAYATVEALTNWGAYVFCKAAATGNFRALFSEMILDRGQLIGDISSGVVMTVPLDEYPHLDSRGVATGDFCPECGGLMVQTGTCKTCQGCGLPTGGCS